MKQRTLSLAIHELDLSVRATNCLVAGGIEDVRALAGRTRPELRAIRNLGVTTLAEIEKALANRGLRLGMSEAELDLAVAFNDPVAVRELASFLDAVKSAGCSDVNSLVLRGTDQLLSNSELTAKGLAVLRDGLQRWGITLGLPVGPEDFPGPERDRQITPAALAVTANTFQEELRFLVLKLLEGEPLSRYQCFVRYFGLDGEDETLDAIGLNGEEHGFGRPVTRERVRQVLTKARSLVREAAPRLRFHRWEPIVDFVMRESPVRPEDLFCLMGYPEQPHLRRAYGKLEQLGEILDLDLPFKLRELPGNETMVFYESGSVSSAWVERLRETPIRPFGVVAEVAGRIACEEEHLRRLLTVSGSWDFLDSAERYFWRRPVLPPHDYAKTRNAVLTSLCKVFSSGGRASSADLAMSIGRDRIVRRGGPPRPLPKEVVEGVAERSGLFRVDAGEIRRRRDIKGWNSLSERDLVLLRVAAKHGRVLSSKDLYSSLVREGLSQGNAGQVVQFSPFLVHTQSGVGEVEGIYKFVLDSVPTATARSVLRLAAPSGSEASANREVVPGERTFQIRVTARTLQFGTFFGSQAEALADGRWTAAYDGAELGEVAVLGRQLSGLDVVARALRLKRGDQLELSSAEKSRTLHCKLSGSMTQERERTESA